MARQWLTYAETAALLDVSMRTLRRMARKGFCAEYRHGLWLYDAAKVKRAARTRGGA